MTKTWSSNWPRFFKYEKLKKSTNPTFADPRPCLVISTYLHTSSWLKIHNTYSKIQLDIELISNTKSYFFVKSNTSRNNGPEINSTLLFAKLYKFFLSKNVKWSTSICICCQDTGPRSAWNFVYFSTHYFIV